METNVILSSRLAALRLPLERQSSPARAPSSKERRVNRHFAGFAGTPCLKTMATRLRIAWAKRLLPLLLALTLPAAVQAQFTFTTNNGAITITAYTGPDDDVIIPSTLNGLPVTCLGSNAFCPAAHR